MSRDGSITRTFADGEDYVFRLAWGEIIKLQEARNCGPFLIYVRLHGVDWMLEDVREVVRLGLIGGGMDEIKAKKMVAEYVERRPIIASLPLAQEIIKAGILGPPDEEPLEKKAEAPSGSTTFQMAESASVPSTEPVH